MTGTHPRSSRMRCLPHLLEAKADQHPNVTALAALDRPPLTYGQLWRQIEQVVRTLNQMGIRRNDRIAIALPNGPELAATFVAVACCATSAPLNPAYREAEFEFYLSDLDAKALIIPSGVESPARKVAGALGIAVIELSHALHDAAGVFRLTGEQCSSISDQDLARPDDVALVLHTSGTTSRPKVVPLTHTNILSSALNIDRTLELTARDRCLNVMPLFHIHGLIGATLASLAAGASIVCTPGFDPSLFYKWLAEGRPTWYTAVPTIHQAILARAASETELVKRCSLRFIRSSSSALSPSVMAELEHVFDVPIIESYGMTEAAHQMASNPLPPLERKPGSVGVAAGPQIRIMDRIGNLLPSSTTGEIVIRGANVTSGYVNDPRANQSTFTHGWFRTGDQGYLDTDGYLFVTGRIKEIINRGGMNISPHEVDEVLLDHPAVAQAVTFAVVHPTLGEDVAAAVVLRENTPASETELRGHVTARLADYKVPSQVVIVDAIPKGPTGKLQRIGLAQTLASELKAEFVAPGSPVQEAIASIWEAELEISPVGIHDNFFALGGHSLVAARVVACMRDTLDVALPLHRLFEFPTIAGLAQCLEAERQIQEAGSATGTCLVPIRPVGDRPVFFLVPGGGGGEEEFSIYSRCIYLLGEDQPVYGLFARGSDGKSNPHTSVDEMAADYLTEIRAFQPDGPYILGGECIGGVVALAMAQQLMRQGEEVDLFLMNAECPRDRQGLRALAHHGYRALRIPRMHYHWEQLCRLTFRNRLHYVLAQAKQMSKNIGSGLAPHLVEKHVAHVRKTYVRTLLRYHPKPYAGRLVLLVSEDHYANDPAMGWSDFASGGLEIHHIPGSRHSYLGDHVRTTARQLRACLDQARMERLHGRQAT